jgi:glucokinase
MALSLPHHLCVCVARWLSLFLIICVHVCVRRSMALSPSSAVCACAVQNKFKSAHRVSVERVVSGIGIANIYEFLRQAECGPNGVMAGLGNRLKDKVIRAVDDEIKAAGDQKGGAVAKHAATYVH